MICAECGSKRLVETAKKDEFKCQHCGAMNYRGSVLDGDDE